MDRPTYTIDAREFYGSAIIHTRDGVIRITSEPCGSSTVSVSGESREETGANVQRRPNKENAARPIVDFPPPKNETEGAFLNAASRQSKWLREKKHEERERKEALKRDNEKTRRLQTRASSEDFKRQFEEARLKRQATYNQALVEEWIALEDLEAALDEDRFRKAEEEYKLSKLRALKILADERRREERSLALSKRWMDSRETWNKEVKAQFNADQQKVIEASQHLRASRAASTSQVINDVDTPLATLPKIRANESATGMPPKEDNAQTPRTPIETKKGASMQPRRERAPSPEPARKSPPQDIKTDAKAQTTDALQEINRYFEQRQSLQKQYSTEWKKRRNWRG